MCQSPALPVTSYYKTIYMYIGIIVIYWLCIGYHASDYSCLCLYYTATTWQLKTTQKGNIAVKENQPATTKNS